MYDLVATVLKVTVWRLVCMTGDYCTDGHNLEDWCDRMELPQSCSQYSRHICGT